jgi:type II secretory ATPase GspE/PulE/Tfp pilus assembly ATPase PilB-like protein
MLVHEMLAVKSKEFKRATEGETEVQVAQIGKRDGMVSLAGNAIELVNSGVSSIEEAVSVIAAE